MTKSFIDFWLELLDQNFAATFHVKTLVLGMETFAVKTILVNSREDFLKVNAALTPSASLRSKWTVQKSSVWNHVVTETTLVTVMKYALQQRKFAGTSAAYAQNARRNESH